MSEVMGTPSLDRETWLTVLAPGALLTAAVYVALPGVRMEAVAITEGLGSASQATVLVFAATAISLVFGVASSVLCRLLDRIAWGLKWPKFIPGLPNSHRWPFYPPFAEYVAHFRFGGELLPYSALKSARQDDPCVLGTAPQFTQGLVSMVLDLVGAAQPLPTHKDLFWRSVRRQYDDVASDVVKAWVLAQVGRRVSREAWDFAAKFRQMGDAYRSLALALPVALLLIGFMPATTSTIQLTAHWPWRCFTGGLVLWLTWVLMLAFAFVVMWVCKIQSLENWIQWQGELCRLFYVAYPSAPHGAEGKRWMNP